MLFNIMAQLFGLGAMLSLFLIYQQQYRKKLIIYKLCADMCWVIHYLCLGAFGGAVPNFVGIFREAVFMQRETKKWANNIVWPILFIIANFTLGVVTYNAPINILPILASVFVTASLWLKKPSITKVISAPVSLAFLIYDLFAGSYLGVINESVAIISIVISFAKSEKNDNKKGRKNK